MRLKISARELRDLLDPGAQITTSLRLGGLTLEEQTAEHLRRRDELATLLADIAHGRDELVRLEVIAKEELETIARFRLVSDKIRPLLEADAVLARVTRIANDLEQHLAEEGLAAFEDGGLKAWLLETRRISSALSSVVDADAMELEPAGAPLATVAELARRTLEEMPIDRMTLAGPGAPVRPEVATLLERAGAFKTGRRSSLGADSGDAVPPRDEDLAAPAVGELEPPLVLEPKGEDPSRAVLLEEELHAGTDAEAQEARTRLLEGDAYRREPFTGRAV